MARSTWSGTLSFGLVTIPVKMYLAVREQEIKFNQLHAPCMAGISLEKKCTVCDAKVEGPELVRGFQHTKGEYVLVSEDDVKQLRPEATQSVDILEFVDGAQISPIFYDKPYYLAPDKGGKKAYALLRDSLLESGKVGIARVVIRTKEHLAAVKPEGDAIVLALMHWSDEVVAQSDLDFPTDSNGAPEMAMAKMLIDSMSVDTFAPEKFADTYRESVMALIDARIAGVTVPVAPTVAAAPSNVVNLMDLMQRSLAATQKVAA